eukprot:g2768.t1
MPSITMQEQLPSMMDERLLSTMKKETAADFQKKQAETREIIPSEISLPADKVDATEEIHSGETLDRLPFQDEEFWPSEDVKTENAFVEATKKKQGKQSATKEKATTKTKKKYPEAGEEPLNIVMVVYLSFIHIVSIYGLYLTFTGQVSWSTLIFSVALYPFSALGITAGAHRLWSHKAFKATYPLRVFLMLCQSLANQGSILHWARDHRSHHKYSETDKDPHDATRGLWYSHVGWLLRRKSRQVIEGGKSLQLQDLYDDSVVMFQDRYDPWFTFLICFGMPTIIPYICWGESLTVAYCVPAVLRYILVLHFTWCVNSLAHYYGERPYDENIHPSENLLVSYLAFGEGWHNWHHAFPFDYACSEFGVSAQYNPTKLFIDICCAVGLAYDRKRATKMWERKQRRLAKEKIYKKSF